MTKGTLYLISTPIGNLKDISERALDILNQVQILACEDTRNSQKLIGLLGVSGSKKMLAYHEYNADKMRPKLLSILENSQDIALVCDAGTPLISDPGYRLVRDCRNNDIPVVPVPGANAVLPALQLSGLPSDRFLFNGFLSAKKSARLSELNELKSIPATLIFYESPHRVVDTLTDMLDVFGNRTASVVREITKKFEEAKTGLISNLIDFYQSQGLPKGEIVIVVDRPSEKQKDDVNISELIAEELKTKTLRDAVDSVTQKTGLDRRKIYKQALELKNEQA